MENIARWTSIITRENRLVSRCDRPDLFDFIKRFKRFIRYTNDLADRIMSWSPCKDFFETIKTSLACLHLRWQPLVKTLIPIGQSSVWLTIERVFLIRLLLCSNQKLGRNLIPTRKTSWYTNLYWLLFHKT